MAPLQEVVRQQMRFDHRFTVAHAFDRFDIDRDGTISLKELRIGLRALAKVCLLSHRQALRPGAAGAGACHLSSRQSTPRSRPSVAS